MAQIKSLFATRLYHAKLSDLGQPVDAEELENSCLVIAEDDEAGQDWCEENGYPGYTSYASLTDLPWRFPIFADLVKVLDAHVAAFAADLEFDLGEGKLVLEDLWINILPEGGTHSSHIHPHSVISGTTYVAMPEGTSALKLEDPRSAMMMARPHPPQGRTRGIAAFHLCDARRGRCAAMGELAAPRGTDEHGRGRAHLGQFQLQVGLIGIAAGRALAG
ncbi:TIGR02466 family protein [Roseicyclus elongatus]